MESKKFSLNAEDLKRIGVGALMAIGGAAITYVSEVAAQVDFGDYTPIVTALMAVLVNAGRKYLTGRA